MVQVKQTVRDLLERLPDSCSLEDVAYHLYVMHAVEQGLADDAAGRLTPHKVVAEEMRRKWICAPRGNLDRRRTGVPACRGLPMSRSSRRWVRRAARSHSGNGGLARALRRAGPVIPEIGRDDIREVFVFSYRIVYRVTDKDVRIQAVIHGARDLSEWTLPRSG
ncbi:MAG: type II toxin-antitoxin system RelE/ParE family toxin [Phycisphaerales bacterium]